MSGPRTPLRELLDYGCVSGRELRRDEFAVLTFSDEVSPGNRKRIIDTLAGESATIAALKSAGSFAEARRHSADTAREFDSCFVDHDEADIRNEARALADEMDRPGDGGRPISAAGADLIRQKERAAGQGAKPA